MFHSARLKLTAWYLLIIMLVSVTFSIVIFRFLSQEIERFDRAQRFRLERQLREGMPGFVIPQTFLLSPEIIQETKNRIIFSLAIINGTILIVAGGLGYFLAGRTLKPIAEMVDEQNRFISDASHEFRTPLTSLKSAFEVYLREKDPPLIESQTLIKESIDEVNKLQSLSDSLLNLSQYQKGFRRIKFEPLDIKTIILSSVKQVEPLAKAKSINFEITVKNQKIEANKESLQDLFIILLDNAIKYSPEKSKIQIRSEKTDSVIKIYVTDQGIGIDKKDSPHIFDRFYRADSARSKRSANGYGLGLSIAKKIIDLHQGDILVKSALNKGSTFTVTLPTLAK